MLETDNSIYIRGQVIIAVFVDDILIAGPSEDMCNSVSLEIGQHFDVTNKGAVTSFLGLSITRNWEKHGIAISQPAYFDKLVAKYRLNNAKTYDTPLPQGYQFTSADYEFNPMSSSPRKSRMKSATMDDVNLCDPKEYQELTGSLNHLAVFSRPDISYSVSKLSQFNSKPTATHFKMGLHIIRYLKKTRNYCLIYRQGVNSPQPIMYSDSGFAEDMEDRKSHSGFVQLMSNAAVVWKSSKQHNVAFSTMEAEYVAAAEAAREALARKQFLEELHMPCATNPITILSDSQAALDISENPTKYRQAKHIDIKYHAVRHYIREGKIQVDYVPSEYQVADIFTKALGGVRFRRFTRSLRLKNSWEAFEDDEKEWEDED